MNRQLSTYTTWVVVIIALVVFISATPMLSSVEGRILADAPEHLPASTQDAGIPGQILVKLRSDAGEELTNAWLKHNPYPILSVLEALNVYLLGVPPESQDEIVKDLSGSPVVEFVEPNGWVPHQVETEDEQLPVSESGGPSVLATPNDPLFSPYQWNLHNTGQAVCYGSGTSLVCYNPIADADIDAPEAWDVTTGEPVKIAVLSTGVELDHPDLAGKIDLTGAYDFVNGDSLPTDDHWSGTFQAGIAAAMTNNGRDVAGVSWEARIVPIKVLDSAGDGNWATVANGIIHAANLNDVSIIYIGTSGSAYSQTVAEAIAYAQSKRKLIVAPGHLPYPASYAGVIGVSATNFYDQHTKWTGSGDHIDVSAPGALIASTTWRGADTDGRAIGSNTPAAAAHVAGLAALILSIHPEYTASQVADILVRTADDLGEPGWDPEYGHGRINAYRAVTGFTTVEATPSPPPIATATLPVPPTPRPPSAGETTISITPYSSAVGWVRQADQQANHLGDDDMYTGVSNGFLYHGVVQFDLSPLPPEAQITRASVTLIGQTWVPGEAQGTGHWRLEMLSPDLDSGWTRHTFAHIRSAVIIATVGEPVPAEHLGPGRVNTFVFDANQLQRLAERLRTTRRVSFRLSGAEDTSTENLFSWDSGHGAESNRTPPVLQVAYTVNSNPPTPTPGQGPQPTPTMCTGTWIQGGEVVQGCLGSNGRILGRVFYDRNEDGIQQVNANENGISGAVLVLRNAVGNIIGTATTDAQGEFQFLGLRSEHYFLEEINSQAYPGDTTPNGIRIEPGDFVQCCTVSTMFGDSKDSPPAPPPPPTSTLVPSPTPVPYEPPSPVPGQPGIGRRIQLPALDSLGGDETWIQAQNLGDTPSQIIVFTWGDYSGTCPPQAPGPLKVECSGILIGGSAWTFRDTQLPSAARAAIAYSVPAGSGDEACNDAFDTVGLHGAWRIWENRWRAGFYGNGEPLAVSVNRRLAQPNGITVASAYTGISENMEGVYDPVFGGFMYYVPVLYNDLEGWSSEITIQNSGNECTSLEIWYKTQEDCIRSEIHSVEVLSPGESVRLSPAGLSPGRRGSAWIRASQPLGIVVDQFGHDMLLTSRGMPADSFSAGFSAGSLLNFAPLIYREYNGWTTRINVQNLSSTVNAKVKVYFLDEGGDIIQTVLDWICPRGSQTYELATINNLPGRYVGAIRIESQNWWSPGDPPVDAPNIVSVVSLINEFDGQGLSYNAFTQQEAQGTRAVALPLLIRDNVRFGPDGSRWTSKIAVQNVNFNPGSTSFRVDIYDQNGLIETFCQFVNERQVDYIDLAKIGTLPPGFAGSAIINATCSNQAGGASIVAVAVEEGTGSGDFTKAFEGFRVDGPYYNPPSVPVCPGCAGQ